MFVLPAILLAVLCIVPLARPHWGVVFLCTFYCLEMTLIATAAPFRANFMLANIIWAIVLLLASIVSISRRPDLLKNLTTSGGYLLVALYVLILASLWWTPAYENGSRIVIEYSPSMLLFAICGPLLLRDLDEFRGFLIAFMVIGSLVGLAMMLNPDFNMNSGRLVYMLAGKPVTNALGVGRLGGMLSIAAALQRTDGQPFLLRFLRFAAFFIGCLLALFSGSRGQIIFSGVIVLGFFAVARPIRDVKTFILSVLGLVAAFFIVQFGMSLVSAETTINRWEYKHIARGGEVRLANVLELIAAYFKTPSAWLFGLGFNTFSVITSGEKEPYSHNILVDALCEQGLMGLLLLMGVLLVSTRSCVQLMRYNSAVGPRRATAATLFAFFTFDVIVSMKEGNMLSIDSMLMFGLLASAFVVRAASDDEHQESGPVAHDADTTHADDPAYAEATSA